VDGAPRNAGNGDRGTEETHKGMELPIKKLTQPLAQHQDDSKVRYTAKTTLQAGGGAASPAVMMPLGCEVFGPEFPEPVPTQSSYLPLAGRPVSCSCDGVVANKMKVETSG